MKYFLSYVYKFSMLSEYQNIANIRVFSFYDICFEIRIRCWSKHEENFEITQILAMAKTNPFSLNATRQIDLNIFK